MDYMELKQRDGDLVGILQKLNTDEKEEIAKALKYNDFRELKNNYNGESEDLALEKEIRYIGSDLIKHGIFSSDWAMYKEIVRKAANFQKVKYTENTGIEDLERKLIVAVVDKVWQKMSEEQKQEYEKAVCEFEEQMRAENSDKLKKLLDKFKVKSLKSIPPAVLLSMGLAFKIGGFVSYQILVIVMGMIARTFGIRFVMQSVTRAAFFAVPILNVILSVWLAWDVFNLIFGPAMRKVIPVVFMIGVARLRQKGEDDSELGAR